MNKLICTALGVVALSTGLSAQLTWTQLQPSTAPAARYGHAITLVHPDYNALMFGGFDGAQAFGDTWTWTGSTWQLRASAGPSPRYGHGLARLDYHNNGVLLFGGRNAQGALNGETWVWSGSAWSQLATSTAPSPRAGHALAVDEMAERTLLLFGGRTQSGLSAETWLFANEHWTLVPTVTQPPAREGHVLIYSAVETGFLLQGGRDDQTVFADEWHFDGANWHQLDTPGVDARAGHALVYANFFRSRYMTFGGLEGAASADTAERTVAPAKWLHHQTVGVPSARTGATLIDEFSAWTTPFMLFGGRDAAGHALGDTWRVQPGLLATSEAFGNGCGVGPWGPVGPAFWTDTPLLGSDVGGTIMTATTQRSVIVMVGSEATALPVGGCGLLVKPARMLAVPTEEEIPGLSVGRFELPLPFDTSLRGTTLALQVVLRRPIGQTSPSFSHGVRWLLAD